MTASFPVWMLSIENLTAGWKFDTYADEPADPDAVVQLADNGFKFDWGFRGDLSPGPMDPKAVSFRLYAMTAADVPECEQGHQLVVKLSRPPGAVSRDGSGNLTGAGVSGALPIVDDGFRVRDRAAVWDRKIKRMVLDVSATDYYADLGVAVDLGLDGAGRAEVGNEADKIYNTSLGMARYPDTLGAAAVPTHTPVSFASRYKQGFDTESADLYNDLSGKGQVPLAELMEKVTIGNFTKDGKAMIPYVVGSVDQLPFTPAPPFAGYAYEPVEQSGTGNADSGVMFLSYWSPEADFATAPYRLAVVGGELVSQPVPGVDLHEVGDHLTVMDAAHVAASPKWEADMAGAVNRLEVTGWAEDPVEGTWQESKYVIEDTTSITLHGPIVRTLPTFYYLTPLSVGDDVSLPDNVMLKFYAPTFLNSLHGLAAWAPDALEVLPDTMDDDELDAYLPRFNPVGELQVTFVVVNISDDENMAAGYLWTTLLGCTLTISRGRLRIAPKVRPYRPRPSLPANSPAVTWAEILTTYPTIDWTELDPGLTWDQLALSKKS